MKIAIDGRALTVLRTGGGCYTYHLLKKLRERDEDNLRARFKPGQDALVQAGLIEGDTVEHLVMGKINVEVDRSRAPLTIIELEEVIDGTREG